MKKSENNNYSKFNRNFAKCQGEFTNKTKSKSGLINWNYLFPATLAFICYANGLKGDFVHDDIFAIKGNPDVHGETDIWEMFRNDFWSKSISKNTSHKSYRPFTVLSFRLNYMYTGPESLYFHVINVALHVIVTTLFVYTCQNVLHQRERCAVLAGLLFAVHPIHTEAVSGIVGRADILAAAFYLLSFITYSKSIINNNVKHRVIFYISSLVFAAVAMLSKETGVTVLGVAVVYDAMETLKNLRKDGKEKVLSSFVTRFIFTIFFIAILLGFRLWIMDGSLPTFTRADNPASFEESVLTRGFTYGYLMALNIWLLVAPINMCYDWQHDSVPLVESLADPRNLATFTAAVMTFYIFMSSLLHYGKKHHYALSVSLVLTVVPFVPASNIFFPVGFVLAERVLYIPSMGFCLFVTLGFFRIFDILRCYRTHVTTIMLCLLLLLSLKTWQQNRVWQTRETLFRSGIRALPHNAKVHYNYANFLKDSREYENAVYHYKEALRLESDYASAHNNLGTLLGDISEAESHFREALRLQPNHQSAHINLGNLLFKRGLKKEGIGYLYKAVEIEFRNPDALVSMGGCLMETGNYTQAENYFQSAIEVSPDCYEGYASYAVLLSKTGRHEESALYYKKAYELDSSQSATLVNAAHAYRTIGDIREAEVLLKQAIDTRRDVSAMEELAVLYYSSGRTRESLALYDDIEKQNGNSTETVVRHAKIVANQGDLERADEMLSKVLLNNHNDIDVLKTLAQVKGQLKKHQQAYELLSKVITLTKNAERRNDLEQLYIERGNNYRDIKMYDKALSDYEAVLRINPHHSTAHGNCGTIHHINGSIEKARYHYHKAIELDPHNDIIRDNIARLERLQYQRDIGVG
ncbi:protein O-mannosyl-transferase TMTC1-like isoform X2 [Mercenaria mercenaria]|uniref:protein O-mannosyl-transferase TMTC1-like isoform X2 n=1 Tax=Mercenaria mercenaria TaxID=6596 RepID=UPI00234EE80A|nr:protein O-mannosyl-transferase TMTC1-like isoform X2 [Mercenaria mercenaria]